MFVLMAVATYITQVFSLLYYLMLFYLDVIKSKCDWQSVHYKTVFSSILLTHKMMIFGHERLIRVDEWFSRDDNLAAEGWRQDVDDQV